MTESAIFQQQQQPLAQLSSAQLRETGLSSSSLPAAAEQAIDAAAALSLFLSFPLSLSLTERKRERDPFTKSNHEVCLSHSISRGNIIFLSFSLCCS